MNPVRSLARAFGASPEDLGGATSNGMNNLRFILVSIGIFLAEYLASIFWPFLLRADLFAVWALAVFFLDQTDKINFAVVFGAIIFFDFWSGSPFGRLTAALLLSLLVMFLVKKIILTDSRTNFLSLLWLAGFYYLTVFLKAVLYIWGGPLVLPGLSLTELIWAVASILIILLIHNILSRVKAISRF